MLEESKKRKKRMENLRRKIKKRKENVRRQQERKNVKFGEDFPPSCRRIASFIFIRLLGFSRLYLFGY